MNLLGRITRKLKSLSSRPGAEFPTSRNITIGRGTYYNRDCTFVARDGGRIEIGNYCSIAQGVFIINVNHDFERVSIYPFFTRQGTVGKPNQQTYKSGMF